MTANELLNYMSKKYGIDTTKLQGDATFNRDIIWRHNLENISAADLGSRSCNIDRAIQDAWEFIK